MSPMNFCEPELLLNCSSCEPQTSIRIYFTLSQSLFLNTMNVKLLSTFRKASVKHVTRILMKIPCLFMSQIDCGWSKLTPNSMTIPCRLSRFYLFPMLEHDMDFVQDQVIKFSWQLDKKWWDFHWIWSHFRW